MTEHSTVQRTKFPELGSLLDRLGLTISQVARETGVSRNTLHAIIKGEVVKTSTVSTILAKLNEHGHSVQPEKEKLQALGDERVVDLVGIRGGLFVAASGGILTSDLLLRTCLKDSKKLLAEMKRLGELLKSGDRDVDEVDALELQTELQQICLQTEVVKLLLTKGNAPK